MKQDFYEIPELELNWKTRGKVLRPSEIISKSQNATDTDSARNPEQELVWQMDLS